MSTPPEPMEPVDLAGEVRDRRFFVHDAAAAAEWEEALEVRITRMVHAAVREAVNEAVKAHAMTPEQREYLDLALKREARREKVQSAVIEKTLTGLLWAALVGGAAAAYKVWVASITINGK